MHLRFEAGEWDVTLPDPRPAAPIKAAYDRSLEVSVPLSELTADPNKAIRLQISLWNGALPVDALPPEGWLELA